MEAKKDIRNIVLEKRNKMTEKEWEEKSRYITDRLVSHPFFLESNEIYCYVDFRNEVATRQIIEKAWKMQKKVAVPKIDQKDMQFFYITSWDDVKPGHWGILEPCTNCIAEGMNGCVIMPGAVFDQKRNRIGYGGGYYDTYLQQHSMLRTVAIAFEFQILEVIPAEEHDIRPECIITEENIYV